MMKQYFQVKEKYNDCILFFRLGDFYEVFYDDAILASRELELTLTKRHANGSAPPMCGVPYHSVDTYIGRLTEKGFKVAICEQIEDAAEAKGIVKRDVVKVVTPGTSLDSLKNNYIACIIKTGDSYGISFCDVAACIWKVTHIEKDTKKVIDEIAKHMPVECLINSDVVNTNIEAFLIQECHALVQSIQVPENPKQELKEHFNNNIMKSLDHDSLILCVSSLLNYLKSIAKNSLAHLTNIHVYNISSSMYIGAETVRSLELIETMRDKSKKGSLLGTLDKTITPMGKRKIKNWILAPLINKEKINDRLNAVEELYKDVFLHSELKTNLNQICDLEKIVAKIGYKTCNAKDILALKNSIFYLPQIKTILGSITSNELSKIYSNFDILEDIYNLIDSSIEEDAPVSVRDGGLIKKTYNNEVFRLKEIKEKGASWLLGIESREREKTGIKNLKIKYNKVFGYFLEVTNSNKHLIPDDYIRKQTLVNCERYITDELKTIEEELLNAEDLVCKLEYDIFVEILQEIEKNIKRILDVSESIAKLDVYLSFSEVAIKNNYIKPLIITNGEINIKDGRHPVAENIIGVSSFIENDTNLNNKDLQISLITGPNMGGKSTYMKQVALITLMSQIGSFVPATLAEISIVDKIFTRVGASDDLTSGQSTFMVEMNEISNILSNATSKSLLILDEIGRGTSTLDGLSLAQAIIEYVSTNKIGAKTLFSTHYHELPELVNERKNIKNYYVSVKQTYNSLLFLHKIKEGVSGKSFGIEVAKLAGLPDDVLKRASEILKRLDIDNKNIIPKEELKPSKFSFDTSNYNTLVDEINDIDIMNLTPANAFDTIQYLKSLVKKDVVND
ncbi:DNA mismatch repair protein MutS [Candidatus Epulonipiscioides gigas]|nr:DNA mismatch repair protein MutS [Epulopiscium sp. SCG-C07WGA-EpuloA2]